MKKIARVIFVGFLCGQLLSSACASSATIKRAEYAPFLRSQPLSSENLEKIKKASPKDSVFADMLQAFALMRSGPIEKISTQKEIINLLSVVVGTFEDMSDPANFSKAFTLDEDKNFRGRPHERMYASLMAAVFLMNQANYGLALSYLRNAEFEDRFQKMPFGTDAPLVYALMYWCLEQKKGDVSEINRARDGIIRSVRFLSLQEAFTKALVNINQVDMRPMALSNRLAYMIFEISIHHTLMSAPNNADLAMLIDDMAKNAEIFSSALNTNFEEEYKNRMGPVIKELAQVYGMNSKEGLKQLEELGFMHVGRDVKNIAQHIKQVFKHHEGLNREIEQGLLASKNLSAKIIRSVQARKIALNFTGVGPRLERRGSYEEISVVKPGPDANAHARIREKDIATNISCGLHRTAQGGFSAVLCGPEASNHDALIEKLPSLELLSLSRKATSVGGRKFDEVLKGRAQFRAATEDIASVGAWSAFFLFYMGSAMIEDCNRRNLGEACYVPGLALYSVALATGIFSGTVWLIGRTRNPAADSRFIHLMYESSWLAI